MKNITKILVQDRILVITFLATTQNFKSKCSTKLKSIPAKPVKKQSSSPQSATRSQRTTRPQNPPEQDWSKYTKEYEQDESFWTEYERKFWENYGKFTDKNKGNAKMQDEDEDEKLDLAVKIEPSLCIGCCSCEVIAPNVFSIDKDKQTNPKSTVHNRHGASFEKIMNAAETCPTKAISVDNIATKERLYPF